MTQEYEKLIKVINQLGYPDEFGLLIAKNLNSEKTISRMIGYLINCKPQSPEEIVDEMLAIMSDRERWIAKKKNDYYNEKISEYYNSDLRSDED